MTAGVNASWNAGGCCPPSSLNVCTFTFTFRRGCAQRGKGSGWCRLHKRIVRSLGEQCHMCGSKQSLFHWNVKRRFHVLQTCVRWIGRQVCCSCSCRRFFFSFFCFFQSDLLLLKVCLDRSKRIHFLVLQEDQFQFFIHMDRQILWLDTMALSLVPSKSTSVLQKAFSNYLWSWAENWSLTIEPGRRRMDATTISKPQLGSTAQFTASQFRVLILLKTTSHFAQVRSCMLPIQHWQN